MSESVANPRHMLIRATPEVHAPTIPISSPLGRAVQITLVALLFVVANHDPAAAQCTSSQYTYTFTNYCSEAIFVGQNGPGPSYPPSLPEAGNWAVAPACTVANQASVCTGSESTCTVADGQTFGQCTCAMDGDCPGNAPCINQLCSTTTTFCMPQNWSSGLFWPRTGCTLAGGSLTCATGQCGGTPGASGGQIDCGGGAGQVGPNLPVALFEPTTSTASVNYDVSINSGYNLQMMATPVGGGYVFPQTTTPAACPPVGCTADLNATCPVNLVNAGGAGCLDPCTQCQNSAPNGSAPNAQIYAALMCNQTVMTDASGNTPITTTACSGSVTGGLPTYQDMYCAENLEGDENSMASANQGTPTAFSQDDCFPGTTFVIPTFPPGYTPPAGQGVCFYEEDVPGVNDYGWADFINGLQNCGSLADGTACGGYRTAQSGGGYFADALGYTCRTVTWQNNLGQTKTSHPCLPPTTSGLGTCETATGGTLALYAAVGGVFNAAWLTAGTAAATTSTAPPYMPGTTPYYQTFKTACPSAYTWQYDDFASGFACTTADTVPPSGATFSGFDVTFCTPEPPVPGDCNDDGIVTIEEVIRLVLLALEDRPVSLCIAGDYNGNRRITIDEIVRAVTTVLSGGSSGLHR